MNPVQSSRSTLQKLRALRNQANLAVMACEADRSVTLMQAARKATERVARGRQHVAAWASAASLSLLSGAANAAGATTSADFSAITTLLQAFVDFMTGPFGKAAVVISIIAAFVTWVFAPKEGIFGPMLRVVVAGIAIMNAAVWITNFGSATKITL